jgi:hypothetical protein
VLLFLDHNNTTRLDNSPTHRLRTGPGFHLALAVGGLIPGVVSLFGLPWIVAATVHALNHVKSLATTRPVDLGGTTAEQIVHVRENRVSPLMIHVLIAGSILILPLFKLIPMAVLFGLFLYMGFATLGGNSFFERVRLWVTDPKLYPKTHYARSVPHRVIHLFTLVQLGGLVALWLLKTSSLGILFPILIALLVPLRLLMNRYFAANHLEALDPEVEAEELENRPLHADAHS